MGVTPPLAAIVLVAAAYLLVRQWPDVAYFISERTPVELGSEGDYHFERLRSNAYAQVHGVPTVRGTYAYEGQRTVVAVGVRDTPLLVVRPTLPTERWVPGATPPQPDQRPFTVRGRLLTRAEAPKWSEAFTKLNEHGENKPEWVLLESERPGSNPGALVWFGVLAAFAALNAWFLVRGVLALARRATR